MTGTDGALNAMEQNEVLTNQKYSEAVTWDLPSSTKAIIGKNAGDEEMQANESLVGEIKERKKA